MEPPGVARQHSPFWRHALARLDHLAPAYLALQGVTRSWWRQLLEICPRGPYTGVAAAGGPGGRPRARRDRRRATGHVPARDTRLVRCRGPRPAVAQDRRPIRNPRVGDHAPADP